MKETEEKKTSLTPPPRRHGGGGGTVISHWTIATMKKIHTKKKLTFISIWKQAVQPQAKLNCHNRLLMFLSFCNLKVITVLLLLLLWQWRRGLACGRELQWIVLCLLSLSAFGLDVIGTENFPSPVFRSSIRLLSLRPDIQVRGGTRARWMSGSNEAKAAMALATAVAPLSRTSEKATSELALTCAFTWLTQSDKHSF